MFAYLVLAVFMASAGVAQAQTAEPALQRAVVHEDAVSGHIDMAHPFLHRAADLGWLLYSGDYSDRCYRRRADPYYGRDDDYGHDRRHGRYDDDRDHGHDDHRYRDGNRHYRHDRHHGRYDDDRYDRHPYRDDRLTDRYGRPYADEHERDRYRRPHRPGHYDRRYHRRPFDRSRHDFRGDDRRFHGFRDSAATPPPGSREAYLTRVSHRDGRFYKKKDTATTAMTRKRLAGSDAGSTV